MANRDFRVSAYFLNKWCAFVAFVAITPKSANACNVCTLFAETMATIIFLIKIKLLPLLPSTLDRSSPGNKMLDHGNKSKNHCCRGIGQKYAIAGNGGLKQQWQQKQQRFKIYGEGCLFSENIDIIIPSKTPEIHE